MNDDESLSRTQNPFVTTTTPAMDRAQRLLSLRNHPGFLDLIRISQDMASQADMDARQFPGWDERQIVALHYRAKAALEHHVAWLAAIQSAIEQGEAEAIELREQNKLPEKSTQEVIEESDMLRIRLLQRFEEAESRVAGSF